MLMSKMGVDLDREREKKEEEEEEEEEANEGVVEETNDLVEVVVILGRTSTQGIPMGDDQRN